jgi:hypothetical protein
MPPSVNDDQPPLIKGGQGRSEEEIAAEIRMSALLLILSLTLITVTIVRYVHG